MGREKTIYLIFLGFFLLLVGSMFLVPFLAREQDAGLLYALFGPTCHQKISRSLCLFDDGQALWMGDCTPQEGDHVQGAMDRETLTVRYADAVGYKMPVCSRDVGIYGAMLIGALAYPRLFGLSNRRVPPVIWLVLALVPIGIDGSVQLVSEMGILPAVYESTNLIRLITGAVAGLAASIYAIPILVNMFSQPPGRDGAGA